jgi:hypothetical protein
MGVGVRLRPRRRCNFKTWDAQCRAVPAIRDNWDTTIFFITTADL